MRTINKRVILITVLIGFLLSLTSVSAEEVANSKNTVLNISDELNKDNNTFNATLDNETLDDDTNNSSNNTYYNNTYPIQEESNKDNSTTIKNVNMENTGLPVILIFILLALPGIIQKIKK